MTSKESRFSAEAARVKNFTSRFRGNVVDLAARAIAIQAEVPVFGKRRRHSGGAVQESLALAPC
jgi:hypothetical protein